jgi:hypothetical protein
MYFQLDFEQILTGIAVDVFYQYYGCLTAIGFNGELPLISFKILTSLIISIGELSWIKIFSLLFPVIPFAQAVL